MKTSTSCDWEAAMTANDIYKKKKITRHIIGVKGKNFLQAILQYLTISYIT